MNTNGKAARRKIGGNRYSLKRRTRGTRPGKTFHDWVMTREQFRAMKKSG